ncbi:hypothetical protein F2P81_018226 [Scophthalmus maximus]|uniref:Uncharacterized protein n=1 Tax=Scophthalmus maximus TaxID=52904 RepID=A0A6A4SDD2_SCOMX|nr:hypothetical protein F2P81_018226 [Scophthalmus maximus]
MREDFFFFEFFYNASGVGDVLLLVALILIVVVMVFSVFSPIPLIPVSDTDTSGFPSQRQRRWWWPPLLLLLLLCDHRFTI